MEKFNQNVHLNLDLPSFFRESKKNEVLMYLESNSVDSLDFFKLAELISKNTEQLFSRYHNLFSFQHERSIAYLAMLIENDLSAQKKFTSESIEYMKIQIKIDIARGFIAFVKKYSWQYAFNLVHMLEDSLK